MIREIREVVEAAGYKHVVVTCKADAETATITIEARKDVKPKRERKLKAIPAPDAGLV